MFVRPDPTLGNGCRNVFMEPAIGKHQYICMIAVVAGKRAANALIQFWTVLGERGQGICLA